MSTEIDRRVVEMEFDNKQFEEGVHTSVESLDKLKKSLNLDESVKSLDKLDRAGRSFNLRSVTEAADAVSHRFTLLGNLTDTVFTRISNTAINAFSRIKNVLDEFTIDPIRTGLQEYETQINSVQTILANTRDAMTKSGMNDPQERLNLVNGKLDELNHYADKTIYNFTQMTESIGRFTAAGVELEPSVNAIQGIANLAAISGSNAEQASNAMYMLSQAISTGQTQLYHWNSIVRASMGGEITQQALMKVADVLGVTVDRTVEEVDASGKKIKKTVKRTVKDLMDIEGMSFRDTLQTGWLSGEVWTETLGLFAMDFEEMARKTNLSESEKQSLIDQYVKKFIGDGDDADTALRKAQKVVEDATNLTEAEVRAMAKAQLISKGYSETDADWFLDLAQEGVDAATKVKTFTQLFDTLKEAAQSGWTQSWEYIIGDFYEAKEFLTGLSKFFGGLIDASSEARNTIIREWKEKGGRDLLFNQDPEKGPLGALWNLIYGFQNIAKAVREGIGKIIPPATSQNLLDISQRINDITAKFRAFTENSEAMDKIGRFFSGIASAFGIIKDLAKSVFNALRNVISPMLSENSFSFLDILASIGDWLTNLRETISNSEIVQSAISGIGTAMQFIYNVAVNTYSKIQEWFKTLRESEAFANIVRTVKSVYNNVLSFIRSAFSKVTGLFRGIGVDSISGLFTGILNAMRKAGSWLKKNLVDPIVNWVKNLLGIHSPSTVFAEIGKWIVEGLWTGIKNTWNKVTTFFKNSFDKIVELLKSPVSANSFGTNFVAWIKNIPEKTKEVWTTVKNWLTKFFTVTIPEFFNQPWIQSIVSKVKAIDWGKVLKWVIGISSAIGAFKLITGIGGIAKGLKNIGKGMDGLAKGVKDFAKNGLKLTKVTKNKDSLGNTMLKIAAAIGILVGSIYFLAKMDMGDIKKGGAILGIIAAALMGMSIVLGKFEFDGKSLLRVGAALALLIIPLKLLSDMAWGSVIKGLFLLGLLFTEIMGFVKLTGGSGIYKGFISLALGISLLMIPIKLLSGMDTRKAWMSILQLGSILLEIGIMSRLGAGNMKMKGFLAFGLGIALLMIPIKLLSGMDTREAWMSIVELGAILAELVAFSVLTNGAGFQTKGLLSMSIALAILTHAISSLSKIKWTKIVKSVVALGAVMLVFAKMTKLIGGVSVGKIAVGVAALAATLFLICKSIIDLSNLTSDPDSVVKIATSISAIMLALAVAFRIIGTIPITGALAGIASFAILVGGVGGIILALGALQSKWGNMTSFLDSGGTILQQIGTGLGNFIGGIVGGFTRSAINLPQIGTDLSAFMANSSGFITGAKNVDSSVLTGVSSLCGAILAIAATEFLNGLLNIFNFFTGDSSIDKFAQDIKGIGAALCDYAESVRPLESVSDATLEKANKTASALSTLNDSLPRTGGRIQKWVGEKDLDLFATNISKIGGALSSYAQSVSGIADEGSTEDLDVASKTAMGLSQLNASLPRSGGWFQITFGEKDLNNFSSKLPALATALRLYASEINGMSSLAEDGDFQAATDIAKGLAALAASLPQVGGSFEKKIGSRDMNDFSAKMPTLAKALVDYATTINGISGLAVSADITAAQSVAEGIASVAHSLDRSGGFTQSIIGEKDLNRFSTGIVMLGGGMKQYIDSISGITTDDSDNAISIANDIVNLMGSLTRSGGLIGQVVGFFSGTKEETLLSYTSTMTTVGANLAAFCSNISGVETANTDNAFSVLEQITGFFEKMRDTTLWEDIQKFFGLKNSKEDTLLSYSETMVTVGNNLTSFVNTVKGNKQSDTEETFGILDTIKQFNEDFKQNQSVWDSFKENLIGTGISNISADLATFGTNFSIFATGINGAAGVATNFAFVRTILESFANLAAAFDSETNEDLKYVDISTVAGEIGQTFVTAFGDVIRDGGTTISAAEQTVLQIDAATIDSAYRQFYNSGQYLAEGLARGITSMAGMIRSSALAIASDAIHTLQVTWQIHSPSRVTTKMGEYFGQGSAIGISNTLKQMRKTVTNYAQVSLDELNNQWGGGLGRVQQTIQNGMSKLDLSDDAYGLALDLTGIGSGSSTTSKGPNGNPVGEEIGNSIADNVNAITSGGGVVVNFNDKNMVEHLNSIEDRIVELTELIDTMQMVLDTGELVGAMAGKMDSELGTLAMRRGRGN